MLVSAHTITMYIRNILWEKKCTKKYLNKLKLETNGLYAIALKGEHVLHTTHLNAVHHFTLLEAYECQKKKKKKTTTANMFDESFDRQIEEHT